MTVSELRKLMKGVPGNLKVYIRDHDHSRYEYNGAAGHAEIVNRKEKRSWEIIDKEYHSAPNKYFIIQVV